MPRENPSADEPASEIHLLKERGTANGWGPSDFEALFLAFDRLMAQPRFLDPDDQSLFRITVLNELTFLIAEPVVGDHAWQYIGNIAKTLGRQKDDPHGLRESWRIVTFEIAAEPPETPEFLGKLFSLAGDKDTRWAVFAAYENHPWRLRPHAHKYSRGEITDAECDRWLIGQGWGEDEVLMQKSQEEQGGS